MALCACTPRKDAQTHTPAPATAETFRETQIYTDGLYKKGLSVTLQRTAVMKDSEDMTLVLPLEFGSLYRIEFREKPKLLRAVVCDYDPTLLEVGTDREVPVDSVLRMEFTEPEDISAISYVPRAEGEYLTVYLSNDGTQPMAELYKSVILAGSDTEDDWWTAPADRDALGGKTGFADFTWDSVMVYQKLFDKFYEEFPEKVSLVEMGKDQSETYDMRAYVCEPDEPFTTVIMTAGMHGTDTVSYIALGNLFREIMYAEEDSPLYYVQQHVKLVIVPVVNVWALHNGRTFRNSESIDLDTDFEDATQAETRNLCALINEYAGDASALIDFKCYNKWDTDTDLYFSCSAGDKTAFLRGINHIYHELKDKGLLKEPVDTSCLLKDSGSVKTLEGCAYKIYGIPAYTVWHSMDNYYAPYSAEGIALATQNLGNILISVAGQ